MHLRKVPVNTDILGNDARDTEPDIKQVFITGCDDQQMLELKLYIIRKRIEKRVAASDIPDRKDFYVVSLSTKSIIYKGMLESMQLRHYFPDLANHYLTSGLALVHSRSVQTHSRPGVWHNRSVSWHTTGKSIRYGATVAGWKHVKASCPLPVSQT